MLDSHLSDSRVLVNEFDEPINSINTSTNPPAYVLPRSFSVFLFNSQGKMLIKRNPNRLWTNASTGYHTPNLSLDNCVRETIQTQWGINQEYLSTKELGSFMHGTELPNGLEGDQLNHIFIGIYKSIRPPTSSANYMHVDKSMLERELTKRPQDFSPWLAFSYKAFNFEYFK